MMKQFGTATVKFYVTESYCNPMRHQLHPSLLVKHFEKRIEETVPAFAAEIMANIIT